MFRILMSLVLLLFVLSVALGKLIRLIRIVKIPSRQSIQPERSPWDNARRADVIEVQTVRVGSESVRKKN